ncbi:MAG: arylsulfatase [Isosphaeraceae bacterium]
MRSARSALGFLLGSMALLLGTTAWRPLRADPGRPPNVVILVADDLGWNDVGFHNPAVKTPNLDRLVSEGLRLDRHYSYPICSATRAALLTGISTSRTGVNNASGLDLAYRILPQDFQAAEYQTWMFGKWHLGGPADYERSGPKYLPHQRGFDYFHGFLHGAIDYVSHERHDLGQLDWQRNGAPVEESGFTTDLLADDAVKHLTERDKTRPVLLYLAFNAVHGPLSPPPGTSVNRRDRRPLLLANVSYMDRAIGRVLDAIDREGMRQNTIVLFLSDNGGQLNQGASNDPWRGEKGTVFEGGIHTPAAIRWPGVIKPGSTSRQVISVIDWYPTLANATKLSVREPSRFDGKDLWANLIQGKVTPPDGLVIAQNGTAVFQGPWKLVVGLDRKGGGGQGGRPGEAKKKARGKGEAAAKKANRQGGKAESTSPLLFRIDDDPEEKTDLAARFPDVVQELLARGKSMTNLKRRGGKP